MAELTKAQRDILLRPVNPGRVLQAQGQSHLPAFDVEAHLTRVFGFEGWDREIVELWLVHETEAEKGGRVGWTVTYGCRLRLTVRNPQGEVVKVTDGCATGSANNLPSRGDAHDFAMKNADSYALKRCAKALGDQFGLSLYNKGSVKALVRQIVAYGEDEPTEYEAPQSMGNDERDEPPVSTGDTAATASPEVPVDSSKASEAQVGKIRAQFRTLGVTERPAMMAYVYAASGERVESLTGLTKAYASVVIEEQIRDIEKMNA